MSRRSLPFGLVCAGLVLGACQTDAPQAELAPRPAGVEGQWVDPSGVSVSSLSGGTFTTTDSRTGAPLSNGTYRTIAPTQIAIEYRRQSGGDPIAVNCNQVAADRLSCVNSGGTRFDLSRRA